MLSEDEESEDEVHPAETPPPAIDDEGGSSEQETEPEILLPAVPERRRKRPYESKPTSAHHVFSHFSTDPICATRKTTKTTRARCNNRPDVQRDGLELPQKFWEIITADHKVSSDEHESRMQHRYALVLCRISSRNGIRVIHKRKRSSDKTKVPQRFVLPFGQTWKNLHRQCSRIPSCLRKSYEDSRHFDTPSLRDNWNSRKGCSTSERRNSVCIGTNWCHKKMVE